MSGSVDFAFPFDQETAESKFGDEVTMEPVSQVDPLESR